MKITKRTHSRVFIHLKSQISNLKLAGSRATRRSIGFKHQKLRNEAMRSERQFKVSSSRFKAVRNYETKPNRPHPALSHPMGEGAAREGDGKLPNEAIPAPASISNRKFQISNGQQAGAPPMKHRFKHQKLPNEPNFCRGPPKIPVVQLESQPAANRLAVAVLGSLIFDIARQTGRLAAN